MSELAFTASSFAQAPSAALQRAPVAVQDTSLRGVVATGSTSAAGVGGIFKAAPLALAGVGAAVLARRGGGSKLQAGRPKPAGSAVAVKAFENELGVQAPTGFWDPLGFTKDGNVDSFKRRRVTEIKHGRVAMLATMGYITPELTGKFPGYLSPAAGLQFSDVPNGLAAISKVPGAGWLQIILYGLFCESTGGFGYNSDGQRSDPGNCGWRPPLLATEDADLRRKRLNAELANGRLAMMAIIGMFFQDGLTGSAWGDWALYTASPLRAFENELGVQAPVGFFDPLGLSKDGDVATFKRRRATELKHGRVAMYATMGFIVPEYFKFPGYLSPSEGLKFADVPNGLAALSKVPLNGWLQIVLFCGYFEFPTYNSKAAPGDLGWKAITSSNPDELKRKLNVELANGRLAMVAIMGMLFQNGTFGTTGPEMWFPSGAFENELGVQAPTGFWDPAGYCADGNADNFRRRRETEIKHGRVAMIACMGYIVPEYFRWPGYLSPSERLTFEGMPSGLKALSQMPAVGLLQMILFAGLVDFAYFRADPSREPGDFKNGGILGVPNGSGPMKDVEGRKRKLNAELANGRLAMMAIIGMFFQDGLTGQAWGDWALFEGSPLRAFESELGVQAPFGFWDPLGLTKDGDADAFRRRRVTEIKHGRISMLACLGYIVPEYVKWPGYCAPSTKLAFSDIPNGLAALSKVPGAGWTQMLLFGGLIEKGLYVYDPSRAPGDFENGGVLGVPNGSTLPEGEGKTRKLNSELANGRLAMMAIMGMMFQDGLTGSAWGDWALYTDSPLRASEDDARGAKVSRAARGGADAAFDPAAQMGATAPLGFWDPAGFTSRGGKENFLKLRGAELKHGRVAMMAIVGFLGQHFWRFPGFEDLPDGVGALTTTPGSTGFACLFLLIGFFELRILADLEEGNEPGNFSDPFKMVKTGSGGYDEYWRNFELNNGRLAMVGAIGTITANWYTGFDAFQQWQEAKPAAIAFVKTTLPFAP